MAAMGCDVVAAMCLTEPATENVAFNLLHLIDNRMLNIYTEGSLVWTVCTAALF